MLRTIGSVLLASLALLCTSEHSHAVSPQVIHYQGVLRSTTSPGVALFGSFDITVSVWDQASGGTMLWSEFRTGVPVSDGLLSLSLGEVTPLDISVFSDSLRFLEIQVGSDPPIVPRVRFTSQPYAYRVSTIDGSIGGVVSGDVEISGTLQAAGIRMPGATAGQALLADSSGNATWGDLPSAISYKWVKNGGVLYTDGELGIARMGSTLHGMYDSTHVNLGVASVTGKVGMQIANATVGGGASNTASGLASTVSGGFNNVASGDSSAIGGGVDNIASAGNSWVGGGFHNYATALHSAVSGGMSNKAYGEASFVGGGFGNAAKNFAATVAGGIGNVVLDDGGTIGGGASNMTWGIYSVIAGGGGVDLIDSNSTVGDYSTVSGGWRNSARNLNSVIGGGFANIAAGDNSSISGGQNNETYGAGSTISGGETNTASGDFSTIAGGYGNEATGENSFVAGTMGKALHPGSIVISANSAPTSTGGAISSGAPDQIVMRASGGLYLTDTAETAPAASGNIIETRGGAYLSGNGTSWINASDKNLKENFEVVDGKELLQKLADLPITEWNYKEDGDDVRHIGPMAQDFRQMFGLGSDDKGISTIDPAGIALAAIQALYLENLELKRRLNGLESRLPDDINGK